MLTVPGFATADFHYHIFYYRFVDSITVPVSASTVVGSANTHVFGAVLSVTVFQLFIPGINNSKEDFFKSSSVTASATNLILACCGSRLH